MCFDDCREPTLAGSIIWQYIANTNPYPPRAVWDSCWIVVDWNYGLYLEGPLGHALLGQSGGMASLLFQSGMVSRDQIRWGIDIAFLVALQATTWQSVIGFFSPYAGDTCLSYVLALKTHHRGSTYRYPIAKMILIKTTAVRCRNLLMLFSGKS